MPPLNPNPVSCLSDTVTQVRDDRGRLLGCIPRIDDDSASVVNTPSGTVFELRWFAHIAVFVPEGSNPFLLDNFTPLNQDNFDLSVGPGAGDDPDIGVAP